MSFSDNRNAVLHDQIDLPSFSFEHPEPPMNLAQEWVYNNMVSNGPSYPTEVAFFSSFEEGSESNNATGGAPFQNHLNQDPYGGGFLLSTPFNPEDYDQLQLPQQQHIYPSSAPSSYYHPSTTPTIKRVKMAHSPVTSTATTLSLNSSPSPSPSSPERQPQALLSSSTTYRPGPIPVPTPFITATMAGTEESRRRGRRREQNRKAQFVFRQKRKDEVQRLQLEVLHLKERLATVQEDTKWRQVTTSVNGCGASDGGMVLCALCKGYAAQCQ